MNVKLAVLDQKKTEDAKRFPGQRMSAFLFIPALVTGLLFAEAFIVTNLVGPGRPLDIQR